jgi:hypothetical protein
MNPAAKSLQTSTSMACFVSLANRRSVCLIGHVALFTSWACSAIPWDTGHVGWTPCEDISVIPQETGKREFLFGVEIGPNDDILGCVG